MKSNSKQIVIVVYFISIFWLGFLSDLFPLKTSHFSGINFTHEFSRYLYYGYYTYSYDDGYTYSSVQWSFSSINGSKITVLAMDQSNFRKFDINDSSTKYYILSDGKMSDNGFFNIPYDNRWFILFFNNDPNFSGSEVIINVEFIVNPFLIITLPIIVASIVVSLYIIISIYFKKKKKENNATCFFFFFIVFLLMYLYISLSLSALIH